MHRKDIKGLKNRKYAQIPWLSSIKEKLNILLCILYEVWIVYYVHEKICRNSKQGIRDSSLDLDGLLLHNIKKTKIDKSI